MINPWLYRTGNEVYFPWQQCVQRIAIIYVIYKEIEVCMQPEIREIDQRQDMECKIMGY